MQMLFVLCVCSAVRLRVEPPDSQPLLTEQVVASGGEVVRDASFDALWLSSTAPFLEPSLRPTAQLWPRIPAAAAITRKHYLATVARALDWRFTPVTLSSTDELDSEIWRSVSREAQPFEWLSKSATHRGVLPVSKLTRERAAEHLGKPSEVSTPRILQARVAEPLLIDGSEFDVGVYVVAVQQPGWLQYELFDDVLLRFCSAPSLTSPQAAELFATDPRGAEAALHEAWVIDDKYRSAWQMATLQPSLLRPNGSAAAALADAIRPRGLDWRQIWATVENIVASVLSVPASSTSDGGGRGRGGGADSGSTSLHYDLLRFDFKLDVHGKPWLFEVNSNPNLVPKSDEQAAVLRRLCRFLVDRLATLASTDGNVLPHTALPLTTTAAKAVRATLNAVLAMGSRALSHEAWHHSHNPHSHTPHSHNPHSHNPHSHTPHSHTPHSHTPPSPSPPPPLGTPLTTGSFTLQDDSGSTPLTRSVFVNVPSGTGPFPVQMLFHSGFGTGSGVLNQWTQSTATWNSAIKNTHILVAPDGDQGSFNVWSTVSFLRSRQDDVGFVEAIIDYLATKPNVAPQESNPCGECPLAEYTQVYGVPDRF